jgi:hypothetical protein
VSGSIISLIAPCVADSPAPVKEPNWLVMLVVLMVIVVVIAGVTLLLSRLGRR